jgi:PPK2 family polyphosphate:nucleotide phosphotransferase
MGAMNVTRFDKKNSDVKLNKLSTEPPKGISREEAEARLHKLGEEIFDLQDLLWGARTHAVLIVLQGRDTAGKDGAIKHVVGALNPRGVNVVSFGVPTREEVEHDFLWRIHRHAPRKGEFAIFNRSHYEDVLVVRVHGLVPESIWKERYGHIADFEELLTEHNTIVIKYFLHISKDEQEKRLREREADATKAWKLNVNDWRERERWDDYTEAYEIAIGRTSHERAPWIIVPADAKWFRNLVIADTMVSALRPYRKIWEDKLEADGKRARAELEAYRSERKKGG